MNYPHILHEIRAAVAKRKAEQLAALFHPPLTFDVCPMYRRDGDYCSNESHRVTITAHESIHAARNSIIDGWARRGVMVRVTFIPN